MYFRSEIKDTDYHSRGVMAAIAVDDWSHCHRSQKAGRGDCSELSVLSLFMQSKMSNHKLARAAHI